MVDRQLRIVFMGTPEFAVPSLQFLFEAGYQIAAVVTAPDKPGGRGMKQILVSPVKSFAISKGLPVLQPSNLKSKSFYKELKELNADLQVVVAFRMLPEVIWRMPPLGTINLHGSLLPAYRGAAPIQWAIINGEKTTGLTTFFLAHQIDTGHIIRQVEIPIIDSDNAGTLHDRMMHAGAGLVLGTVDLIASGKADDIVPQQEANSSHAPKIHHGDARIQWTDSVSTIHNLIRGMSPYPGAWTVLDGMELKIFTATIHSDLQDNPVGKLTTAGKRMLVQASDGEIEILEMQLAGKKRMTPGEFLNGYKIKAESVS